ncbi:MAG: hypothetical protein ACJAT0_002665, partial [Nonlabens sp.]
LHKRALPLYIMDQVALINRNKAVHKL